MSSMHSWRGWAACWTMMSVGSRTSTSRMASSSIYAHCHSRTAVKVACACGQDVSVIERSTKKADGSCRVRQPSLYVLHARPLDPTFGEGIEDPFYQEPLSHWKTTRNSNLG